MKTLVHGDYQANELVSQLQQPMNLVSYHLKKMREVRLVTIRRSEADGRDVYYSLDLTRLRELFLEAGQALHPSLGLTSPIFDPARLPPLRVLFICTHNSARSQMVEGWLRFLSRGKLEVLSAGSQPTIVHPEAIHTMAQLGIDIRAQQSRSMDAFLGQRSITSSQSVIGRAKFVRPFQGRACICTGDRRIYQNCAAAQVAH